MKDDKLISFEIKTIEPDTSVTPSGRSEKKKKTQEIDWKLSSHISYNYCILYAVCLELNVLSGIL